MSWTQEELDKLKTSLGQTSAPSHSFADIDAAIEAKKSKKENIGNVLNQNIATMQKAVPTVEAPVKETLPTQTFVQKAVGTALSAIPVVKTGVEFAQSIKPERVEALKDITKNTLQGQTSVGEAKLQAVGNIAGMVNDYTGEKIGSVAKMIYSALPQKAKTAIKDTGSAIISSSVGRGAEATVEKWNDFAKKYPNVAKDLAAAGNITMLAGDVVGATETAKAVGQLAKTTGKSLKSVGTGVKSFGKDIIDLPSAVKKDLSVISSKADSLLTGKKAIPKDIDVAKIISKNYDELTPAEKLIKAQAEAPELNIKEVLVGMRPDEKKMLMGNGKEFGEYLDIAKTRNLDNLAETPLEYAAKRVDEAENKLSELLNSTGNEIGDFRKKVADVKVPEADVAKISDVFNSNLAKINLEIVDGKIQPIAGKVAKTLSTNDISTLQELYDNMSVFTNNPTLENAIDTRGLFDSMINYKKGIGEVSDKVDPLSRAVRAEIAKVNASIIGPEEAAKLTEYSNMIEQLNELRTYTKSRSGAEFLLKRVLSERGGKPKELLSAVEKYTDMNLIKDATFSKIATELIGNADQKGLLEQTIKNAGVGASVIMRGNPTKLIESAISKGVSAFVSPEDVYRAAANLPKTK